MGLLDDFLVSDAKFFTDTDSFGEQVTYTPRGGSPISINAIVVRKWAELIDGTFSSTAPLIEVYIHNDAILGVSSIDTGGDTVTVSERVGGAAAAHPVDRVIGQDAGMWHLELR